MKGYEKIIKETPLDLPAPAPAPAGELVERLTEGAQRASDWGQPAIAALYRECADKITRIEAGRRELADAISDFLDNYRRGNDGHLMESVSRLRAALARAGKGD